MQYHAITKALMRQYGQAVELWRGEDVRPVRAFLQPLTYKSRMYLEGTPTDLGLAGQDYFLYLGPAEEPLDSRNPDAGVRCRGQGYEIRHCEAVCFGEEPLYQRAILRQITEEGEHGEQDSQADCPAASGAGAAGNTHPPLL